MEKYTMPSLPTISHVLEDVTDKEIVRSDYPLKLSLYDEMLQNTYTCFYNCKRLEEYSKKHMELKQNLKELNRKLEEKVARIKPQKNKQ